MEDLADTAPKIASAHRRRFERMTVLGFDRVAHRGLELKKVRGNPRKFHEIGSQEIARRSLKKVVKIGTLQNEDDLYHEQPGVAIRCGGFCAKMDYTRPGLRPTAAV
jgi:hypothetical protein